MAGSPLEELLRRARRRWWQNLILAQAVGAGCVAAGGLMVLLLLGTQVLESRWVAGVLGVALAYGLHRTAKQRPSLYQVAQAVDRNLGLHDALSTAYFFSRPGTQRSSSAEMCAAQLAMAESLCRDADLRRAVPLRAPRAVYLAAALTVVAGGLFTLRYGVTRRLELGRSLPKIVLDTLRPPVRHQAARGQRADRRFQEYLEHFGVTPDEQVMSVEDRLASAMAEEAERSQYSPEGAKPLEMSLDSEAQEGAGEDAPGDRLSLGTQPEQGQSAAATSRRSDSESGDSNSLLEKFRDAFANLLNRLKIQPKGGESQQVASSALAQSESAQGRQTPNQRGMPGSGRELSEGASSSEAQEMQAGEGAQKSSSAPGRRGREGETEASREGRSGIGSEEGSKELRDAEQLAAMGKISELIGRRSQTLSGEVMVEVTSGKQQLRTAYSQQQATHTEAGGQIHRDEIPLAYQSYVERYFEQIHKLAAEGARPQK